MVPLLFTLIFSEMALIMIFVFKTPLRKIVIMGLDRVKRGRGQVIVKTVGGTVFVMMMSSVYSVKNIQKRSMEEGGLNPTDRVLLASHLLEASLMGFSLFLALMIDRLHHYMRELRMRRKSMEAVNKQTLVFDDGIAEVKALEEEASTLKAKVKMLEVQLEVKKQEANTAESTAVELKKQSEGFLLEYDRLVEENQNLRSQLQSTDQILSTGESYVGTIS